LISSGIASIHFSPTTTQPQFARLCALPSGNAKPSSLAEQLKTALAGESSIKVNEIRYVAEDSSVAGIKVAAQLTQKVLGAAGDKFKDFFEDPNKMLQMILAAESMRSSAAVARWYGWTRARLGRAGPGFGLGKRWGFRRGSGGSGGQERWGRAVAPACGILARQAAVAKELARWGRCGKWLRIRTRWGRRRRSCGLAREVGWNW